MRREVWEIPAPTLGDNRHVIAYGHWGVPVLFFPAEGGHAGDLELNGIIHELAIGIEAGRIKVYAVDSNDGHSWSNNSLSIEHRAQVHNHYHNWIVDQVVPAIHADCGGAVGIATAGASLGGFHAVNFALRRADLFPHALGMSASYDPTAWMSWGDPGDAVYFNNPLGYVRNLHGEPLDWLRSRVFIQLCVGQGAWEVEPTGALAGTLAMAGVLAAKGIPHNVDVWGVDVPHDWPSWRRMVVKHLGSLG